MSTIEKLQKEIDALAAKRASVKAETSIENDSPKSKRTFTYYKKGVCFRSLY